MQGKKVEGGSERDGARDFTKRSREFLKNKQGKRHVKKSDHRGEFSPKELKNAEKKTARRARESDPEVLREYAKPAAKWFTGD